VNERIALVHPPGWPEAVERSAVLDAIHDCSGTSPAAPANASRSGCGLLRDDALEQRAEPEVVGFERIIMAV